MAIGHEQMEVERAAAGLARRRASAGELKQVEAAPSGSFLHVSTGEHHYINWVGEDSAEPSHVSIWDSIGGRVNVLVACVPGPDSVF
jgi:hypothetical protein